MALASISLLPDPPLPTDAEAVFDAKAGVSLTAQQAMVPQLNDFITGLNTYAPTIDGAASAGAQAQVAAQNAAMYAAIAQGASGVGPYGNPGDSLQVNPARNGLVYGPSDGNVGDVKISAKAPNSLWFPANGAIRSQVSAPTLFTALGLIGKIPGISTTQTDMATSGAMVDIASRVNADGTTSLMALTVTQLFFVSATAVTPGTPGTAIVHGITGANSITYDPFRNLWLVTTTSTSIYAIDDLGNKITGTAPVSFVKAVADINGTIIGIPLATSTGVYRSTDGGITWVLNATATSGIKTNVATDNQGTWLVCDGLTIKRSTNGGQTWVLVFTAATVLSAISTDKHGIWLISGVTGQSALYKSVDNGASFYNLSSFGSALPGGTQNVTDIAYSKNYFYIVRSISPYMAYLSTTSDAVPVPIASALIALTRVTASDGNAYSVAPTASANFFKTVNAYSYDPASQFKLPDFTLVDGLQAWIKAGLISFGKGATFSAGLLNAAGINSGTGMDSDGLGVMVAVGASGLIRRTTDYGVTWATVGATLTSSQLRAVTTNKKGLWVAVGAAGTMLRSTDNGATWAIVPIANNGFNIQSNITRLTIGLNDVLLAGCQTGLGLVSPRRSTDGGLTWSPISTLSITYCTLATNSLGIWLVGDNAGNVYRSVDNGVSFGPAVASGLTNAVSDIKIWQNGIVLLSNNTTTAGRRSLDGGISWNLIGNSITLPFAIASFAFGPNGYALAYLLNQAINAYYSTDYGATWSVCATNTNGVVQSVSAAVYTPQTGYAALGSVGTIFTAIVDTYI